MIQTDGGTPTASITGAYVTVTLAHDEKPVRASERGHYAAASRR